MRVGSTSLSGGVAAVLLALLVGATPAAVAAPAPSPTGAESGASAVASESVGQPTITEVLPAPFHLTVRWASPTVRPDLVTGYRVQARAGELSWWTAATVGPSVREYTLRDAPWGVVDGHLDEGEEVVLRVVALGAGSLPDQAQVVRTAAADLPEPTDAIIRHLGGTSVVVEWDDPDLWPELVDGYEMSVEYADGSGWTHTVSPAARSASIGLLERETDYRILVRRYVDHGPHGHLGLAADFSIRTLGRTRQLITSPDLTGDGRADALRVTSDGTLMLHRGLGRAFDYGIPLGSADGVRVYAPGDWTADRRADLVGVDTEGRLWLHRGNGAGDFAEPHQIGHGWTGYRLMPAGDLTADRVPDLLAIDPSGRLWLYPGIGDGRLGRARPVGAGWRTVDLHVGGDMSGDGVTDLLSIDSSGRLYFYTGRGGGAFARPVQIGHGWGSMRLASGVDLDGDSRMDLLGMTEENGWVYEYSGLGHGKFISYGVVAMDW